MCLVRLLYSLYYYYHVGYYYYKCVYCVIHYHYYTVVILYSKMEFVTMQPPPPLPPLPNGEHGSDSFCSFRLQAADKQTTNDVSVACVRACSFYRVLALHRRAAAVVNGGRLQLAYAYGGRPSL